MSERSGIGRALAKKETPRTIAELADAAEQQAGHWLDREVWWRVTHWTTLVTSSVLASVAGATALAEVWHGVLAGGLALTASALTAAAAALRPAVMAAGSGAKAAKYLALARDAHQAEDTHSADDVGCDIYYTLLARYDAIRTSPEPALPALAQ
ncbi:hypothetical protein [Streptomyces sp. NPDC054783]